MRTGRLASVAVVALAISLGSAAPAGASVPKETFQRLKKLDDTLTRIRDGVRNGDLGTPVDRVIRTAQDELAAVGRTFPPIGTNPKVHNFDDVQRIAANLDLQLDNTIALVGDVERRRQAYADAENTARELEDAIRRADRPGHRSKAALEAESLRALMRGVRNEVADPRFSQDGLVEEIREVVKQKGRTLGRLPKVFGLRFVTVFLPLEQVQNSLQEASVASTPDQVVKIVDRAIDAKLGLVQMLLEASTCTINGDGRIKGTGGSDVICGSAGKDTINGGGGVDVIKAGGGADAVKGGAGNDTIAGGGGADTLYGNAGADSIDGGKGRDTVFGGAGPDEVIGGPGKDIVIGGAGDDNCVAGKGDIKAKCQRGPRCEPGDYSATQQEIVVPDTGSAVTWFPTSIPNHSWYQRRGYDNGGCDYSNREFLATIDVIGGGTPIAWTHDLSSFGDNIVRDVHDGEWCPAPHPPDGEVRNSCHIHRPQLGFDAPPGTDSGLLKTYSVAVSYQALGGGQGVRANIYVHISWRLR